MLRTIDHQDLLDEQKFIASRLVWEISENHSDERRLAFAKVDSKLSNDLYFTARVNKAGERHYILQEGRKGGITIRRWGNEKGHTDPETGKVFDGPHKHYWTDEYGDRKAYEPDPPISIESVDKGMLDFLKECNIALMDGFEPYPGFKGQRLLMYSFQHLSFGSRDIAEEQVIDIEGGDYDGQDLL